MKKNNTLYVLYKFTENDYRQSPGSFYDVKFSFDEYELINFESKTFTTKEDLVCFVTDFINDRKYTCASLLSVEDYNLGMETVHKPQELKNLFLTYGVEIKREESENKGLFGRFL